MAKEYKIGFYIDGFNFYYGLCSHDKWKRYYWIDIVKFCRNFLKEDQTLAFVKYFTARPINVGKCMRQNVLMETNKALNGKKFKVYYGKYYEVKRTCKGTCKEVYKDNEEKQSDVNIALNILEDYILEYCNKTIIISADSDLLPAARSIMRLEKTIQKGHFVEFIFPPEQYSSDIYNSSFSVKLLKNYKSYLNRALMPLKVKTGKGIFEIPSRWKEYLRTLSSH